MENKFTLANWLASDETGSDKHTFQNDFDAAIYNKIKTYSRLLQTTDFDENSMLHKVLASEKPQKTKVVSFLNKAVFKIAAVIAVSLGVFYVISSSSSEVVVGAQGTNTAFILPDKSKGFLQPGAKLSFDKNLWQKKRAVNLTGKAFFDVEKGSAFLVKTAVGTVEVLGTEFDVVSENKQFVVTCFEGKVYVKSGTSTMLLTQHQSAKLISGKLEKSNDVFLAKPSWINNQLTFANIPFRQVVANLENHFKVKIAANSSLNAQPFTGSLPAGNIETAIKILETTYQITFVEITNKQYQVEVP